MPPTNAASVSSVRNSGRAHRRAGTAIVVVAVLCAACRADSPRLEEIETAVWAFHSADTARDAEAVINLLWPDFTMIVDGARRDYAEVVTGSRQFMASLESFHTTWTDLRIIPLGADVAIATFQFHDSITTSAGDVIRSRGPTTFVWERRSGEWRLRFADADHYPIDP